jgi:anti-sigma factor RsiW
MLDVTAYIESGTIEACLLGQASPAEVAEMERLASQHPAIAAEVAAVRAALDALQTVHAEAAALPPPAHLKVRVLAAAEAAVPSQPASRTSAPVRPATSNWSVWLAIGALLACAGATYLYVQETQATKALSTQQAELKADLRAVTLAADSLGLALEAKTAAYDALAMRCSRAVQLKGLAAAPSAAAFVYWNEDDGAVMARVDLLPPPPTGKAYQLWAIVDGKPYDLGMLPMRGDSLPLTRMPKVVRGATAFAVTLEKESGVPQPEGEMYVMGAV